MSNYLYQVFSLLLGITAVAPLLIFAHKLQFKKMLNLLGWSLILAAAIYILFATMWGDLPWVSIEAAGVLIYASFYWLAYKYSAYWLALGWLLHPIWDVALHLFGPGHHIVPQWYALACVSFDVSVAAYITFRTRKKTVSIAI